MALNYSLDFQKFKDDLKDLLCKVKAAVISWYTKQMWLKTVVPFLWFENLKNAQNEISLLRTQIESERLARIDASAQQHVLEERYAAMEANLNWVMNNPNLNASAKAVASWLQGELRPETATVSRAQVEATARKR